MGLVDSLEEFRDLHKRAKAGALSPPDLIAYHAVRDKLAHLLLSAQHIALLPGQRPRRTLRVARALQVDIEFYDGAVRAMTLQVSSGGFAAPLVSAPRLHEDVKVALRIPGAQPLQAAARVVAVREYLGNAGTSFQFVDLDASEAERMEMLVFDAVVDQFESV